MRTCSKIIWQPCWREKKNHGGITLLRERAIIIYFITPTWLPYDFIANALFSLHQDSLDIVLW